MPKPSSKKNPKSSPRKEGFWFKNKDNQKNIGEEDKIKENLLNQLKSEFPETYNSLIGNETCYELIERINKNKKKIIEDKIYQAKENLAAEKAENNQIKENNKFLNVQIEKKEKTIENLTKGLENKAELKELHDEAMQEVKNERTENNKILSNHENFLEKLTGNYQFQGHFSEDILKNLLKGAQLEEGRDFVLNKKQITSDFEFEDKNLRPDCILFLTERVTYQDLPQNNAKCSKTASSTKWGASRPIFAGLFCCILRYFGVTLGR